MCVQYIRGGGVLSTSGGAKYIGGIPWVHRGDIISTSRDVQYIGGYHDACGGYYEYIGGCSVHQGVFSTLGFSIEIERFSPSCSPTCIMISAPDVLMVSPWCTHGIPPMYWTSPDVLMISPTCIMIFPHMHHDIPLMYSWYPPDVLNTPDVLNIHYTGWI